MFDGTGMLPEADRRPGDSVLGGSARSLLLTVLGELVVPGSEPVWTASLLYVLGGLGVSEQAARQAISRASDTGWITSERLGRDVRWSVTPLLTETFEEITERVASLYTAPEHWDGNAVILWVSIPQGKKTARKRLYSALGWSGFGNPTPGLWISPHVDRLSEAKAIIDELGLRESVIAFVGRLAGIGIAGPQIVEQAWNLDAVAAHYATLLDTYEFLDPEPGDDLLFSYLALGDEWRKFPAMDPQLPRDALPDWIGRRAADTFVTLRARWKPSAAEHWAQVVRLTAPR
jgi:phenylacetic acid degradation operon negative regulatory protein